jgi:tRNA-specific 2-thiouridylase
MPKKVCLMYPKHPDKSGATEQAGGVPPKKKIVVAMSGGVDSSVAAALLKRADFNVIGAFMKLYDSFEFRKAEREAKEIAKFLKIPFLTLDFKKEFEKEIIDYFLREYKKGRTPNPCVRCNQKIKFGFFLKKTAGLDADYIATGHYARIKNDKLLIAKDKEKDQTYFLYNLKQNQLKKILFPIGNFTKPEVRKIAKDIGMTDLVRPETSDICFIKKDYRSFLKKHLKLKPGPILNTQNKKIGQHQGLPLYTIGQRKQIRIAGLKPYYVLKLDLKKNALIVTDNEKDLYQKELIAEKVNWISPKHPDKSGATGQAGGELKLPLKIKAKIRYLHRPASAIITKTLNPKTYSTYNLIFSKSQRAITPGQSVVFYSPAQVSKKLGAGRDQEVLGGGVIR